MLKKIITSLTLLSFILLGILPYENVFAQEQLFLPPVGEILPLSPPFTPLLIKGLKIHKDDPFQFDFIINQGEENLPQGEFHLESLKLVKYFLASLTIPENDLWVNLSPYEKNRITTPELGLTDMGKDLLSQDYVLKQLTSSLIYPEGSTGKKFWARVYALAQEKYHTTNVPINTFNKVWIVPSHAVVYENSNSQTAYVVESKLKVMLEQDYLSLQKHATVLDSANVNSISLIGANIVREIVIPELTKEVNDGKNFANLRQITNSLILAAWFKRALKASILAKLYVDQKKIAGVDLTDRTVRERIYQQYIEAYKKGVYNYIKEETDPVSGEIVPRKYFSGGYKFLPNFETTNALDPAQTAGEVDDRAVTVQLDKAQITSVEQQRQVTFGPLIELAKAQLLEFGEAIDTAEKQRRFAEKYQGQIQQWLDTNKLALLNTIPTLNRPKQDERYERNLILPPVKTPLGQIALFIHVANPLKGVPPHFHGDNEIGGFAWIDPLNTVFEEQKWLGLPTHIGQRVIQLNQADIIFRQPGEVYHLVDDDGPHVMLNTSRTEPGAFLELYVLPPNGIKGFDIPVPQSTPGNLINSIVPAVNANRLLRYDDFGIAAKNGGWREVLSSDDDTINYILHSPDAVVFKVVHGVNVVIPQDQLDRDYLRNLPLLLRDPEQPRLFVAFDAAMINAIHKPAWDQTDWPVKYRPATVEEARDPNNINRLASGIIREGEYTLTQADIDQKFSGKPVKLVVIGGGTSGLSTAFQAVDSKLDGVVLFETGLIGQSFSNAAMPFEDMRTPPRRVSLVQLGVNSSDSQYLNLQNPDNLEHFRQLALEGEKVEQEAFGARTKLARPDSYDTDLTSGLIPTARAVLFEHFGSIANAIVENGGLIGENDAVVNVDVLSRSITATEDGKVRTYSGLFEVTSQKGVKVLTENIAVATGAAGEKLAANLQALAENERDEYALFTAASDFQFNEIGKGKLPIFQSHYLYDPRIIRYLKTLPSKSRILVAGGGQSGANALAFIRRFRSDIIIDWVVSETLTKGPSQMPSGLRTQAQMFALATDPELQQDAWQQGGPQVFGVPITLPVFKFLNDEIQKGTIVVHDGKRFDDSNYSIATGYNNAGRLVSTITDKTNPGSKPLLIDGGFISAVGYDVNRPARDPFHQTLAKKGLISLNTGGEIIVSPDGLTAKGNEHIFVTGIGLGSQGSPTDGTTHGPAVRSRLIIEKILGVSSEIADQDLINKVDRDFNAFKELAGGNERVAGFLTLAANQPGENKQRVVEYYNAALGVNSPEAAARYVADVAGQSGRFIKPGFSFVIPGQSENEIIDRVFATEQPGFLKDEGKARVAAEFGAVFSLTGSNEAAEQLLYPITQIGVGKERTLSLYNAFHSEGRDPLVAALLTRAATNYYPPHVNDKAQLVTQRKEKDSDKALLVPIPSRDLFNPVHEALNPGGIDLNTTNLDLQIKRDGNGFPLPVGFQNLERIHIDGLNPVIIRDVPILNLAAFLQH